jgi:hypothetical protein
MLGCSAAFRTNLDIELIPTSTLVLHITYAVESRRCRGEASSPKGTRGHELDRREPYAFNHEIDAAIPKDGRAL